MGSDDVDITPNKEPTLSTAPSTPTFATAPSTPTHCGHAGAPLLTNSDLSESFSSSLILHDDRFLAGSMTTGNGWPRAENYDFLS